MRRLPVLASALTVLAAANTPALATSSDFVALPSTSHTVTLPAAVKRSDCATTRLAGRTGVTSLTWTVTQPLSFAIKLSGPAGSDYDLAVFDRLSGREIGGSSGFGDNEVVTGLADTGTPLDIQVCHVSGPARSVRLTYFSVALTGPSAALTRLHDHDRASVRAMPRALASSVLPSGRSEYRHLADFQAELKKLAQTYPAIVRGVTLPVKTFQGRDTMGVEISGDVNRADDQKPVSFIMGIHHAREWPSGEIPMEFAYYLAQGFGTDKEITALLNHVRVVIVPVINSDGYNASREDPDFADQSGDPGGAPSLAESVGGGGGTLAYRRKNCDGTVPNPAVPCEFQVGVDPNRNYGFNWGGPGASTSPNSQSYRGTGMWSEPETQAVHQFSQTHDVTSLLTMHNFAALVLRPPGLHNDGKAPDEDRLKALGDAMGNDTGYTSEYSYQLYDTSGTTEDWNYGAAGTFGYTIEMGPDAGSGGNFHVGYQPAVIDQWTGTGIRKGRGLRRALLRISEEAANRQDFATLIGHAPPGRILRLHKTFKTSSAPVCQIASPTDVSPPGIDDSCESPTDPIVVDDKLDYTTKVDAAGTYAWIVTPSTRPFVGKKGGSEAWTMTCEDAAGKVYDTKSITIGRDQTQTVNFTCGGSAAPGRALGADKTPPSSTIRTKSLHYSRSGVSLAGRTVDTAPRGLTPRVAKVLVTIGRHTHGKCAYLRADGTFGKAITCKATPYVVAHVKAAKAKVGWSYSIGTVLPASRYFIWVRGIDASGNYERKQRSHNHINFRIR